MLARRQLLKLIPHQGPMCLLDEVISWTSSSIVCQSRSHLAPENPLRRDGELNAVCGIEYGLQAAAVHGALVAKRPQPPGYLAAIRSVEIIVPRLDEAAFGVLRATAELHLRETSGCIYSFALHSAAAMPLLRGRAAILLPPGAL
jgi:predicted hotdog family 3-hydroxylacyl-ACP dehydratase